MNIKKIIALGGISLFVSCGLQANTMDDAIEYVYETSPSADKGIMAEHVVRSINRILTEDWYSSDKTFESISKGVDLSVHCLTLTYDNEVQSDTILDDIETIMLSRQPDQDVYYQFMKKDYDPNRAPPSKSLCNILK